MPIDQVGTINQGVVAGAVFPAGALEGIWLVVKFSMIILASSYFIFSLIVLRQVNFLTEILITETAPLLRGFAIVHAGFALGVIILLMGLLFF